MNAEQTKRIVKNVEESGIGLTLRSLTTPIVVVPHR